MSAIITHKIYKHPHSKGLESRLFRAIKTFSEISFIHIDIILIIYKILAMVPLGKDQIFHGPSVYHRRKLLIVSGGSQ